MDATARMGMRVRQEWAIECAHGELNAVIGAGLAHESAYMSLDCTFLNAELACDLTIGPGHQDQVEHLPFAVGEMGSTVGE